MTRAPANERLLLGSILLLGSAPGGDALVSSGDFCDPRHAAVWEAMRHILGRGEALDVSTLEAELERVGRLALVGGLSELCEIVRSGGTHTIEHYARVVRDAGKRRSLSHRLREMLEATESADDPAELARRMVDVQGAYNAWDDGRR